MSKICDNGVKIPAKKLKFSPNSKKSALPGRALFLLSSCVELFFERLCKLIGAGSVVSAADALQKGNDLFCRSALNEFADALQISAAAADEFHVVDAVLVIQIEDDLLGAGSFGRIGDHDSLLSLRASRSRRNKARPPCPPTVCRCNSPFFYRERRI